MTHEQRIEHAAIRLVGIVNDLMAEYTLSVADMVRLLILQTAKMVR